MNGKRRAQSSTEQTLVFATVIMLITYIYLTMKSLQQLPPIPSLDDNTIHWHHYSQEAMHSLPNDTVTASSTADTDTDTDTDTSTPFPQQIDFTLSDELKLSTSDQFESIIHPAVELLPSLAEQMDNEKMIVPKFYNPPSYQKYGGIRSYLGNYGQRLMTLEEAQSIGSFVLSKNDGSKNNNNHHQKKERLETIFVAIASYRDYQCKQTIESIFSRATYPERIRIAVVDQLDKSQNDIPCSQPEVPCTQNPNQILCKYKSQLDFLEMDAAYAVGPVFARHLGHRMYRGEYFAMQCDAHVDFIKDWDVTVINAWKSAKNEMAVLTTYLSDVHGAMDDEGNLKVFSRPVMCRR